MAKKIQSAETIPSTVGGFTLLAGVAEGWRVTQVDQDRMIMVHPDHPPRIIEMRSIKEGDVLPRESDMVLGLPPAIGGA